MDAAATDAATSLVGTCAHVPKGSDSTILNGTVWVSGWKNLSVHDVSGCTVATKLLKSRITGTCLYVDRFDTYVAVQI